MRAAQRPWTAPGSAGETQSSFPDGEAPGPAANNVGIACTPTDSSWLNRIEARFTALRYLAPDSTDHKEQGSMIRRYITWRDRYVDDRRLRSVADRANAA
ncbi:hypothetical protein GCM10010420_35780 [Streptomyces glaucosporus]|uniref:Integrase n=1 Tax=Streptomyces glaucosporus TaxID=284044 RepID=A0ABN3IJC0_9ACTN